MKPAKKKHFLDNVRKRKKKSIVVNYRKKLSFSLLAVNYGQNRFSSGYKDIL